MGTTALNSLNVLRSGGVHFDVDIDIEDSILQPVTIGKGDPSGDGPDFSTTRPTFRISIDKAQSGGDYTLDNVTIRVFLGDTKIHEEHHDSGPLAQLGEHVWSWDGFSDQGRYSAYDLTHARLQVTVTARHYPLATGDVGYIDLDGSTHGPSWITADVDKKNKIIDVFLRFGLGFITGGARQHREELTDLFKQGVEKYWSREAAKGVTIEGDLYEVRIHVATFSQSEDDVLGIDIHRTNAKKYVRSHNFGVIDAQIYYNAGAYTYKEDADARFMYTSAHEFGHSVLQTAGGTHFSTTHKGSTTIWQKTHDQSPKYPPSPDEIDMMFYYDESDPADFYTRVRASDGDILRMLSMSGVELD